ncbi:beta-ketoacyl-[acyl-carrier-protein] synthase family protein [Streptomyces sp. NPDC020799]|uniref:beta-ketoacyl-[acyl-carrier-protein] synthase family protein n=1 Tax=Streptomyces sp. NPDC020799 TaxID=3365091 RepID=UPI0037A9B55C
MTEPVAVTGVGLVTPGGSDRDSTWSSVQTACATSAYDPVLRDLSVSLSCRVPMLEHSILTQHGSANLDPAARFGLVAIAQALEQAHLDPKAWDGSRVAVVTGASSGGMLSQEKAAIRLISKGPNSVSPYFLPAYLINMIAANIALRFGVTGPSQSVSTACASGASAIGMARTLLVTGQCDIALVCASEAPITKLVVTGFTQVGVLSRRASRPFDATRDGFVISEGAGALVLERDGHAAARRVKPLAHIIGYGASTDAHHLVQPHPTGLGIERAIWAALSDAGVTPDDVDHVNAHGTSTKVNDRIEAAVLQRVFPHRPPVTSAKGALGHTLGAAGAIEAALTVLAMVEGKVPPTAGLNNVDAGIDIDIVTGVVARQHSSSIAISNSFGFGGHNAVVVFAHS